MISLFNIDIFTKNRSNLNKNPINWGLEAIQTGKACCESMGT